MRRTIEIRKLVFGICLNHYHPSSCCFIILLVTLNVLFNLLSEISMFVSIYLKAIALKEVACLAQLKG